MKTAWVLGLALFCTLANASTRRQEGQLVLDGIPQIPAEIGESLRPFDQIRAATFAGWLPAENGMIISTRFADVNQLHVVRKAEGARSQITYSREPINTAVVSRNELLNGIVYLKDQGGDEYFQLHFLSLNDGSTRQLTEGKAQNVSPVFDHAGTRVAFSSTLRNGRDYDLYLVDVPDGKPKRVRECAGYWIPLEFSPDGKQLLAIEYRSILDASLHLVDIESGKAQAIAPSSEQTAFGPAVFSADGSSIYFTSDKDSNFLALKRWNVAAGKAESFGPEMHGDIEHLHLSPDGKQLAFSANVNGSSEVRLVALEGDQAGKVAKTFDIFGTVLGLAYSPNGHEVALSLSAPTMPGDVYTLDLRDSSLKRWTLSELGGLGGGELVDPTVIDYPTFDRTPDDTQRIVPALYYRPKGDGPFPVVIDIHGGPESQRRPQFDGFTQYLVSQLKVAVIAPNVRGSSGYGKRWLALDNGRLRENSVKDIGALLDWIKTREELDSKRVIVSGGSYGGYMVLASLVHYSARLAGGIDVVGISDFVTFLETTNPYRQDLRRIEYGDERDPEMREFLKDISPLTHVRKIKAPLFVIQGQNDPRVPASEAEQIVKAVRRAGKPVWYLLALDEGHGFRKQANREFQRQATVMFIREVLGLGPVNSENPSESK